MNRTPKIIPPINKKLLYSIIGSGRISRRIIAKPFRKKKKQSKNNNRFSQMLQERMAHIDNQIVNTEKKKAVPWQTASAKIIFYYWNGLGHPFVHHRPEKNKTTSLAIFKINKNLLKYGKERIIYGIKTAHKIFNAGWFKYRHYFSVQKINLPNFFEYCSTNFKGASRNKPGMPRSWFKECLKGERYLEQTYSIKIKDKNPKITKSISSSWEEYRQHDKMTPNDINNLIRCGQLLQDFCQKNNFDLNIIISIINNMLNKWHTYKPAHSGYLTNNIFWGDILPKELVRYGLCKNLKEMKL